MNKKQKIEALVAAGVTDDLSGHNSAELDALLAENAPAAFEKVKADERAEDALDASPNAPATANDPRTGKKIAIRIEVSSEPGGKEDVFANVNGFTFLAHRGKWIELDEGFVKHLESIEIEENLAVLDASGKPTGEIETSFRNRFAITRKPT